MNAEGLQVYQELIGILQWAVEVGRVDILLEVFLLSYQPALPCVGHLQAVYRLFGYLKQVPKRKLYFDPRKPMISKDRFQKLDWEDFYPDACKPIPLEMQVCVDPLFLYANHAGDKTPRRSMLAILIFCNRSPIMWHIKI